MAMAPSEQNPVGYEFKWTNPGANPDVSLEELDWKPVTHRTFQTVQECIRELLAYRYKDVPVYEVRALYTTPLKRQWVGLTREAIDEIWIQGGFAAVAIRAVQTFARAIEAKLKERNE
jgi:hypothetical protein